MMPVCVYCKATLADGPLYRQNEKDVDGIWACNEHNLKTDPELEELTELIHKGDKPDATSN